MKMKEFDKLTKQIEELETTIDYLEDNNQYLGQEWKKTMRKSIKLQRERYLIAFPESTVKIASDGFSFRVE
jgi:chemotaxis regulatin CheY-phosphate phosphatase CheZ